MRARVIGGEDLRGGLELAEPHRLACIMNCSAQLNVWSPTVNPQRYHYEDGDASVK